MMKNLLHRHRVMMFAAALLIAIGTALSAAATTATVKDDNPASGESRFATLDGARIHYVNYGKGDEALVLIHGWTQNIDGWRDNVAEFAKRNRVVVIDLPGHGKSDKPQLQGSGAGGQGSAKAGAPAPLYSMDHFARAVEVVMRDAKVKRAVLVGHSMGTPVARQFYRKYPEKTLAIVIADGSLRPFGNKAMMDQLLGGLRGSNSRQTIDQMFGMMMGGVSDEAKARITTSALNTPQHVFVSAMEAMADPAIWGEDKINVPVLAIMAKNPFFPPNLEESFRALAPKMEFHMWDEVGHFLMMEKPKEFNAVAIAWLDKNNLLKK